MLLIKDERYAKEGVLLKHIKGSPFSTSMCWYVRIHIIFIMRLSGDDFILHMFQDYIHTNHLLFNTTLNKISMSWCWHK